MNDAVKNVDTGLVTDINAGAKVLQFNPGGIVTPNWLDAVPVPKTETEKAELDDQYALIAAREFSAAYIRTSDVLEAAEIARDRLSSIPLSLARYCQNVGYAKNDAGRDKRIAKYVAMCQVAGGDLALRHNVARGADTYTAMMQKFPQGQYWIKLCSEARQALKYDLDLNRKVGGSDTELLYTNTRQVARRAAEIRGDLASAKAKKTASEEGTGTGEGQKLGEGKGNAQTLPPLAALPNGVESSLVRLIGLVNATQYETNGAAKKMESNVTMVARVLSFACVMVQSIQASRIDSTDIGVVIMDFHKYVKDGVTPSKITESEVAAIQDAVEQGEELPGIETDSGTEASSAAVAN